MFTQAGLHYPAWVYLPRLTIYKNKYTLKAYQKLFTPIGTNKKHMLGQHFTEPKNYHISARLAMDILQVCIELTRTTWWKTGWNYQAPF